MVLDTICPVCGRYDEDGAHLFFKCKLAVQIWRLLLMERERLELAEKLSPIDVVLFILGAKEDTRMRMIILIWYLWSERNAIREENRSAEGIARCVRTYSDEVLSFPEG
jgi:hypothetical protein